MASPKYMSIKASNNGKRGKEDAHLGSSVIEMDNDEGYSEKKNALLIAVTRHDSTSCEKLLTSENVNTMDDTKSTLLHILAKKYSRRENESKRILRLLLEKKAKINSKDKDGNTPLHVAAREGNDKFCEAIIEYQKEEGLQLKLDVANGKHMTAMHLAAQQGQARVIALLLREGANATLLDNNRYLPLHHAAVVGYPECCELLRDTYPKENSKNRDPLSPLMLAAKGGHEWCCRKMNLSQDDINYQDKQGNTSLHIACKKGFEKFVVQLVNLGADLNIRNNDGNTPVMDAILKITSSCLNYLVTKGANLNVENKHKKGVLHLAAERKADECMSILLNDEIVRGNIDMKDSNGCTPLLIAVKKDSEKCSLMLLDAGASPNLECEKNLTALHLATENTSIRVLQELLKFKKLDINPKEKTLDQTPLHLAARKGSREACLRLLKRGARIHAADKHNRTSLHISAYEGHSTVVKYLVKRGAKTRALDDKKSTALHAAAARGNLECCEVLAEADKQLCLMKDAKGRYPLGVAFHKDHSDVFEFLLHSLPFKSSNKLPIDIAKNLHAHTHKALKDGDRARMEMIVKSRWWEAGFNLNVGTKHEKTTCDNFRQLIKQHPDLAKLVMDKCVVLRSPTSKSYSYNFRLLEDNYYIAEEDQSSQRKTKGNNSNQEVTEKDPFFDSGQLKPQAKEFFENAIEWKRNHPVQIMSNCKRLSLLKHPLTEGWLSCKWNAYIRRIYICFLILQIFFVGSLTAFLHNVHNWKWISVKYNVSQELSCQQIEEMKDLPINNTAHFTSVVICHIILFISTCLMSCVELYHISKIRREYLHGITDLLRGVSVILSFILMIPYSSCGFVIKPVGPWQCGIISFMLSCICLISTINKLPSCAIFASITHRFIKAYLKGLFLISVIILTFAFIFHQLLLQDHSSFESLPQVIVKTVVWVLGDLAYDDSFTTNELSYPILTNFLFLVFICMVGAFIVSLVKMPATDPSELAFSKAANFVNYTLTIDVYHFALRRRHVTVKYCDGNSTLWIIKKLEQLFGIGRQESFIANKLLQLTTNAALMDLPEPKRHWIVQNVEKFIKFFSLNTDDDDKFSLPDVLNEKLDEQNVKLDQLLTICKQLIHTYHTQNEQIVELKQGYQMQNEQIAELKQQLDILAAALKR